jgi:hypothetical protein
MAEGHGKRERQKKPEKEVEKQRRRKTERHRENADRLKPVLLVAFEFQALLEGCDWV